MERSDQHLQLHAINCRELREGKLLFMFACLLFQIWNELFRLAEWRVQGGSTYFVNIYLWLLEVELKFLVGGEITVG